ncbi:helix-turn-helix domain-containing protein [Actinomadura adrarensis]|uniref:Helix-turn-helix domain-containing protein n=1 Tax=Actinomadura adrarensis TaxID=1819600 RepID=A0ABW3CRV0_9ACTN
MRQRPVTGRDDGGSQRDEEGHVSFFSLRRGTVRTFEERFWSKVAIGGPDDCWEWQRSRRSDGYGQFRVKVGQSPQRTHRVAWMLTYGDAGMLSVLHRCDNPPCCNPGHLFLGTIGDNVDDMMAKGRGSGPRPENIGALVELVRRLSDDDILQARREHAMGISCRSIARRLGVHHTTISRLIRGDHWSSYQPGSADENSTENSVQSLRRVG